MSFPYRAMRLIDRQEVQAELLVESAYSRLVAARQRDAPSTRDKHLKAANRLGQAFLPLGCELGKLLSEKLQNLHPRIIRDKVTKAIISFSCNVCGMTISHHYLSSYHCCNGPRMQFADDIFCSDGKCVLCGSYWPKQRKHFCRQLNQYVIDVVGLPSISNPVGPEASTISEEMRINMRMPGLKVSIFARPPTSPQNLITNHSDILMSHHLVLGDEPPRTGLGLLSVTPHRPHSLPSIVLHHDTSMGESPMVSYAVRAVYSLVWRHLQGGMPNIASHGVVSNTTIKVLGKNGVVETINVPPQTPTFFAHTAHGTSANAVVLFVAEGEMFSFSQNNLLFSFFSFYKCFLFSF